MPAEFASRSDDRVRAVVDGTGRLVDLTVSPELLGSPARNVAQAVYTAVTEAQATAAATVAATVAAPDGSDLESQLADALTDVTHEAGRRLAELATLVGDVGRRMDLP